MNSEEINEVRKRAAAKLNKIRSTPTAFAVVHPVKLNANDPLVRGIVDNIYKLKEKRRN